VFEPRGRLRAQAAACLDDSPFKQDFLNLEKRWLDLARSYEFGQRLNDFSDEAKRKADRLPQAY
jgi:hypothetical protein